MATGNPTSRERTGTGSGQAGRVGLILFGVLTAGGILQALDFGANIAAARASGALDAGQASVALERAQTAQMFNPYSEAPAFTRVMALRALNRPERATYAESVSAWHPQRGLLQLLAGEAWLEEGQPARAAEDLWRGLWSVPIPGQSPGIFWRDAWQASLQAYGPGDRRTLAARGMVQGQLLQDRTLRPEDKQRISSELAH